MTFVDAIRHRGTEVVFLREVLAETLRDQAARRWLLERRVSITLSASGSPTTCVPI